MTKEAIRIMEEVRDLSDSDWEELKQKLLESCNEEEPKKPLDVETKIYNILKDLGMPASRIGYRYIKRAVLLCIEDPSFENAITTRLYPTIADEFNTTASRVGSAIRQAIEAVFDKGNMSMIFDIFGYTYSCKKGNPSNSEFIVGIAEYSLSI